MPRVMTADKNPAYPIAIEELKKEKSIPVRQQKYLNNIVELFKKIHYMRTRGY